MKSKGKGDEGKVRCTFNLTRREAEALCKMRCEPKPSTAAAQVVRIAIKGGGAE